MSENKITLENCKFKKKHRINSTRSIQALKELRNKSIRLSRNIF